MQRVIIGNIFMGNEINKHKFERYLPMRAFVG